MHTSCTSCMRAYICHNIFVYLVPVEVMSKIFQWRFIVLDQKHFINTLPGQVTIWNVYPFSDTSIYKETLVTRDPRLCNWGVLKWGTPGYLSRSFKSMVIFMDVISRLMGKPVVIWATLPLFQQTSK